MLVRTLLLGFWVMGAVFCEIVREISKALRLVEVMEEEGQI